MANVMTILEKSGQKHGSAGLLANASEQLEQELQLALRLGQIEVRFQPQYSCADRCIVGAEALARWMHPVFGEIGARDLFELARKAGLADVLPQHVVALAIEEAGDWTPSLVLSLNITPKQLLGDGFVDWLDRKLDNAGLSPKQVTLEITEEILLDDLDLAARRLTLLRNMGLRISLDDFGAGFCNFDYLKRLPIDALKLDRSMVQGIASDDRDLAVLRAIVTLAGALRLDVVAEGIEDEEQCRAVAAEGCAYWQGFYGSQPLTRDGLMALTNG